MNDQGLNKERYELPILKWGEEPRLEHNPGIDFVSNDWKRKALFCKKCEAKGRLQLSFILKVRFYLSEVDET